MVNHDAVRGRMLAALGLFILALPNIALAGEVAELERKVEEQDKTISTLEQRVSTLEGGVGSEVSSSVVDTIDRRIIDFENHPTSKLFLSSYGAAGYTDPDGGDGTFGMLFVPIFHYQLSDRLHLTGEVEFDLRGEETEFAVEYAQIDFLMNDYMTFSAGKFLLPFNAFSQRIHPAWINKLPSLPPIYGTHGSGGGIVPVLSDMGLQLSGGARLPIEGIGGESPRVNYAFYVTNGPRIEPEVDQDERFEELAEFLEDDGAITSAEDLLETLEIGHGEETEVEFGETLSDNNKNKAVGTRIGILPIPSLELGGSFMWGRFDDSGDLDVYMYGFDGAYKVGPLDLRAEYIRLEFDGEEGGTHDIDGFYVEGGLKLRDPLSGLGLPASQIADRTELVLRYGRVDGETEYGELTPGIVYWIRPSVPLKLAYSIRTEDRDDDEFRLQLAFGF